MKKLVFISYILFACNVSSQAQSATCFNTQQFPLEEGIEIDQFVKGLDDAAKYIRKYRRRFCAENEDGEIVRFMSPVKISDDATIAAICKLYNDTKGECATAEENMIPGLRIHFGLNEFTPVLIYETVCLKKMGLPSNNTQHFSVENSSSGMYIYNKTDDEFKPITTEAFLVFKQDYLIHLRKRQFLVTDMPEWGDDEHSDIQSVVFPWIEIKALIEQNQRTLLSHMEERMRVLGRSLSEEEKSRTPNIKSVEFSCMLERNSFLSMNYQSVVMRPVLTAPASPSLTMKLKSMAANMAHMCPPMCEQIILKLKPEGGR